MLAGALLTSCDMNEAPDGSINLGDGCQSMADVHALRNGIYSVLRGRSGSYNTLSDLQTDLFIGTMNSGNSYLSFLSGQILSNDGEVEGIWSGLYSGLMQVNYFLEKVAEYEENNKETLTEAEHSTIQRSLAEAKFMRAYFNSLLVYYWCGNYEASTANNPATGIPLVLTYQPGSDRSNYPGRSTLAEAYTQIEKDLAEALSGLEKYEQTDKSALAAGCGYLNSYAVKALKARVALWKGDYATAMNTSRDIIDSGEFPLCSIDDYANMWKYDTGSELIFQPYGDADQKGSVPSLGGIFNSSSPDDVKWTATANAYNSYQANDIRRSTFFTTKDVNFSGQNVTALRFNKFPGNATFNSGNTNAWRNLPKPFRTSEQYLIFAEAAQAQNQESLASDYLNELISNRVRGYEPVTMSGNALRSQIRAQWTKECIGEGFRLGQLRRWNLASSRSSAYPESLRDMRGFVLELGISTYGYAAGSNFYVWPIPSSEMLTNPQLSGQQNPGY